MSAAKKAGWFFAGVFTTLFVIWTSDMLQWTWNGFTRAVGTFISSIASIGDGIVNVLVVFAFFAAILFGVFWLYKNGRSTASTWWNSPQRVEKRTQSIVNDLPSSQS